MERKIHHLDTVFQGQFFTNAKQGGKKDFFY